MQGIERKKTVGCSGQRCVEIIALVVVIAAAWLYTFWFLDRGWYPHDEGTIGLSAERVCKGLLPHRDFQEVYTGGLSIINAWCFELFGTTLMVPRYLLFALFVIFVPVVYWLARRFTGFIPSLIVVALATLFSLATYPAAMPSWFNLFFATFALATLFRFFDTGKGWWLVITGIFAGLSILAKISGLYLVAGCVFSLFLWDQRQLRDEKAGARGRLFSVLVVSGLLLFNLLLVNLLKKMPGPATWFQYLLPSLSLSLVLFYAEMGNWGQSFAGRCRSCLAWFVPFLCGLLLPLVVFCLPYLKGGGIGELFNGVFVSPLKRFAFAKLQPLGMDEYLFILPLLGVIAGYGWLPAKKKKPYLVCLGILLGLLVFLGGLDSVHRAIWGTIRATIPVVAVFGSISLVYEFRRSGPGNGPDRSRVFCASGALLVMALCSLIQFPFAACTYFLYVAPLAILGLISVRFIRPSENVAGSCAAGLRCHPVMFLLLLFTFAFALFWVRPCDSWSLGDKYVPDKQTERLTLDRADLLVNSYEKKLYELLVGAIKKYSKSEYILCAPDAPELYFLSGRKNPFPTTFEFFDESFFSPQKIIPVLKARGIDLVYINLKAEFSQQPPKELLDQLTAMYTYSLRLAHFLVYYSPK